MLFMSEGLFVYFLCYLWVKVTCLLFNAFWAYKITPNDLYYYSYSSLTNHKFFFKYRWSPLKISLGRSFLIKCSNLIWNYISVSSLRVVVEILTTLVFLFAKHFWADTSVHRGVFRTLSGIWDGELCEIFLRSKVIDYVCGMFCLRCLEGYWIRLCCGFK